MAFSYNIDEVSQPKLPSTQHDIRQAKKFLMKCSPESNDNLYDHLSELLGKILAQRPENAVEIFEEYSQQLKIERFNIATGIRDVYIPPRQYEHAQQLIKLFKVAEENENKINLDRGIFKDSKIMTPNLLELFYYLEQIDIGLPQSEIILLNLSIRKLIKEKSLINTKFWGKILGRPKNYYIVDAELGEEELSRRHELEADKQHDMAQAQVQDDDGVEMNIQRQKDNTNVEVNVSSGGGVGADDDEKKKGLDLVFPPIPSSNWGRLPPVVPTEQIGTGLNKKVYFACNSPGLDEWIELASVTPQQIVAARQIVRCFTGCLKTPINTFPLFPGNEENYLRAQIARISASTHVSPIGYYIFGKEIYGEEAEEEDELKDEEVEEEEEVRDEIIRENPYYDIVPVKDLIDPSMSHWCHHSQYILEQGRTIWYDVSEKNEYDEEGLSDVVEEEDEDEGKMLDDEENRHEKEIGPPLLTPLSKDTMADMLVSAWTPRLSSEIQQETAFAMIRSNVWPGAFAFAKDKIFGNIYIGWGHKFNAINYCPSMMPLIQDQYKIGPEIMEIQDPSVEAEGGYRNDERLPLSEFSESEDEELTEEVNDEDDENDEDDTDN